MTGEERRALTIRLADAPPDKRRRIVAKMSWQDVLWHDADFECWSHESQLEPTRAGWRIWLMLAGRGFGKTRAGAEWIEKLARSRPNVRIALVGASIDEARRIMVEGVSGLLSVATRNKSKVKWEPGIGRLTWSNGSQAQLFSGDHPDGLRGPEHDFVWADELAKWRHREMAWDNLQMGLRRGPRPRALVTTTPRPLELLKRIKKQQWTVTTTGRTDENVNLDQQFVDIMLATYDGTRIGRQELHGELIEDVEGALWTRELIERCRVLRDGPHRPGSGQASTGSVPPQDERQWDRIVVAVDPPAGVGDGCDACGIVVAAKSGEALYVLADESVQGLSPEGWTNRVAAAAARWRTSVVVAEANNGGAMVKSVLLAADAGLKVKLVHASVGKSARAEPVALRFEAGKAFLCGSFPELEEQLAGLIAGGGYEGPGRSPDRADAMVWALTELGETKSGLPRVRRL